MLRALDSSLDYVGFAREFRSCMTEGQKMTRHNKFREDFYKQVIEKAKQLGTQRVRNIRARRYLSKMFGYAQGKSARLQASSERTVSDNPLDSTPTRSQDFPPYIAFQELVLFFQSSRDESPSPSPIRARAQGKQRAGPHNSVPQLPLVLAFDEAHTTTQRHRAGGEEWSVFNELRHALRRLHSLPLFSLFLSTTGKISQFTSAIEEDLSKRVVEGTLVVIQPYTDLGFDPLAHIIAADGSWNLEQLTEDSQTCSQGRPLYVSLLFVTPVVIYEVMIDSEPGIWKVRTPSSERSFSLRLRNSSTRTIPLRSSPMIKCWHVYPNGFPLNSTRPIISLKRRRGSRWKGTCEFASKLMLLLRLLQRHLRLSLFSQRPPTSSCRRGRSTRQRH